MDLSLIVPAYNEEGNIRPFFDAVQEAFSGLDKRCELIFVDDGSADQTAEVMRSLLSRQTDRLSIKVVIFSRNFGKEAALYAGLRHADADLVGFIDSDLQQLPETVVEMVHILDTHPEYDCVAAYQRDRNRSALIDWCSKAFYKLLGVSSGMTVITDASDFRVFRCTVAQALLSVDECYRFSKGIFSWIGFNTYAFAYTPSSRFEGTSTWSFRKLVRYAWNGLLSFTAFPLKIATYLGFLAFAASSIYLVVVLTQRIIWGVDVPGYATIVALILLLGGIQLLVLGIIGEYLARVYTQGKQRPLYIEKAYLEGPEDE
ncbi:MAG: glycosyltransferase family 2 protein [Raoultibacter sp.]